jgi:hypothetical protein
MSKDGQIRHLDLCVTLIGSESDTPIKLFQCQEGLNTQVCAY